MHVSTEGKRIKETKRSFTYQSDRSLSHKYVFIIIVIDYLKILLSLNETH